MDNFLLKNYVNEILVQTDAAEQSLKENSDIFNQLHHFLIHAANVYKILFPYKNPKYSSKEEIRIMIDRENSLSVYFKKFSNISIKGLDSIKDARNDLEHFDERLDQIILSGNTSIVDRSTFIGITAKEVFGESAFFKPNYLRNIEIK